MSISIEKLMNENIVAYARIEFKENWNPEPILHTICAFANDIDNGGGGYIVVGVKEENGMPVHPVSGIPATSLDRMQKDLLALCHKIKPLDIPVCEPVIYDEKNLLLIWAPGGYERPYKANESMSKDKKKLAAYVRRFSNTVKASEADLKELHSIGNNVPFKENGSPLPLFETDEDRSYFTVTLKIHEAFLVKDSPELTEDKPKKTRRSREQISNEVLKHLVDNDYTQNELAQLMGYKGVSKTFSTVIEAMINDGLIKYIGGDSERSPYLK